MVKTLAYISACSLVSDGQYIEKINKLLYRLLFANFREKPELLVQLTVKM